MRLGIFAKTFVRPTVEETLDAVKAHGLDCVQFNMACAGLPSMPDSVDPKLCNRIRKALEARNITMAAVSGTFNMIHPDPQYRKDGLRRLRILAEACPRMGTKIITLCTGTRDPENMWRRHPENDTVAAWEDLAEMIGEARRIAEKAAVVVAFEPERANIIDSAEKAELLLVQELYLPSLRIVIDPANLVGPEDVSRFREILDGAWAALSQEIVLAHAKDFMLTDDGEDLKHVAAGKGLLDYDYYLARLRELPSEVPLILHGLDETEVEGSLAFLRGKLQSLPNAESHSRG
jgi:sugar phosphate isomerase/epimerase